MTTEENVTPRVRDTEGSDGRLGLPQLLRSPPYMAPAARVAAGVSLTLTVYLDTLRPLSVAVEFGFPGPLM